MSTIRIVTDNTKLPTRGTEHSAGYDIYAKDEINIKPNEIKKIATGLYTEIPTGWFGLIKERSSLGAKGMKVLGGVIDSDYRGEIFVVATNLSTTEINIKPIERFCQMLVIPHASFEIEQVENLLPSNRIGGFGSTGK